MAFAISDVVRILEEEYGDPDWWPAETPFEVAVGAILTQRTSWRNVEMSIEALRKANLLTPSGLLNADRAEIERLIRPSGFYRQKTRYLVEFASYVEQKHNGDFLTMSRKAPEVLRQELLQLRGIGPETADSILLYALAFPSFVVDAYTVRVLARLGIDAGRGYDSVKRSFEDALDDNHARLARAHALMVIHCKDRCKSSPACGGCPFTGSCALEAEEKE